jgi:hypothetical protein
MNFPRFSCSALIALLSLPVLTIAQAQEATATTDPVGFVTLNVLAGSGVGVGKSTTLFSLPLMEAVAIDGQSAGTITGLTANSITSSNAGWTPGALSNPLAPHLIQITSGNAEGRMFLIASSSSAGGAIVGAPNTVDTLTISSLDAAQVDLTALDIQLGIDTYRIFACDTLSSFFGTPDTSGVLGGANPASADSIVIVLNGLAQTYWYNTSVTPPRWSRQGPGNPDASNVALIPNYGMQFGRLANTPLSFVVTGSVPVVNRQASVKNSGTTILSQFWPVNSTVADLGLQNIDGWTSGSSTAVADAFVALSGTTATTYFFDGTNWRRQGPGNPISNTNLIPLGASIKIVKKGSEAGYSTLSQEVPYNLN